MSLTRSKAESQQSGVRGEQEELEYPDEELLSVDACWWCDTLSTSTLSSAVKYRSKIQTESAIIHFIQEAEFYRSPSPKAQERNFFQHSVSLLALLPAEGPTWFVGVTLAMPLHGRFSIFISLLGEDQSNTKTVKLLKGFFFNKYRCMMEF